MAYIPPYYADRVMELTTTQGMGDYTLAGALPGFQAFSVQIPIAAQTFYCAFSVDSNGVPNGAWEVGLGTLLSATSLHRDSIYASSTGRDATAIDWGPGTRRIMVTQPASQIVRAPTGAIDVAFNAANFSTSGGGTWTVDAAAVLYNRAYYLSGVLMWQIYISWFTGTSVIAGAPTLLKIPLPGVRYNGVASPLTYSTVPGLFMSTSGDGFGYFQKPDGSAFAAGSIGFFGLMTIF